MPKAKPIEPIYRQFGAKIESMRAAIGLTQVALAECVELERTSIANIEAGRQRILLDDVQKFADAFGTTPKFLLKGIWF